MIVLFNIFIFHISQNIPKKDGERPVCKTLEKIYGLTSGDILDTYGFKNQLPIDIAKIAENIGIKLGSADFTKLEQQDAFKEMVKNHGHILGAVRIIGDEIQISYHNAFHDDTKFPQCSEQEKKENLARRQRFTIAHEIAHCCLHMEPKVAENYIEFRTSIENKKDPVERSANIFAGELLMPTHILTKICSLFDDKIPYSILTHIFRVSKHVVRERIEYLKILGSLPNSIELID